MKTQAQIYWEEHRKIANLNQAFMDMVKDGMTAKELEALIEKRPQVYSRFSHWIPKLP